MKSAIALGVFLFCSIGTAAMTENQLYAASMENDAQFIECVGNIFLGVANLQRTITKDLSWDGKNSEYMKVKAAKESLEKASGNLQKAVSNSDLLLKELPSDKKAKFAPQLEGFKKQVKDLDGRLLKIVDGINKHQLPKSGEIHDVIKLAIAGTGFGMEVSKKNNEGF